VLAESGLFDVDYYVRSNADVRALNVDPLLHYVERGAQEGRNPRADFDTAYYLEQCRLRGDRPSNPLLHYITIGSEQGLKTRLVGESAPASRTQQNPTPRVAPSSESGPDRVLWIDSPDVINGSVPNTVSGGLSIAGWGLARAGVKAINIAVDGQQAATAHYGVRRQDVAAAYPHRDGALSSGFAALIPSWALPNGPHLITVTLVDNEQNTHSVQFNVEVSNAVESGSPAFIRRRMAPAEVKLQARILVGLKWLPMFRLLIRMPDDADGLRNAHLTLISLHQQAYSHWTAMIVPAATTAVSPARRKKLFAGCEDVAAKTDFLSGRRPEPLATFMATASRRRPRGVLLSAISAGDTLGSDALLEMALASGLQRNADFIYSDERRANPVTKSVEAYFKPAWSPDLLLSTNYVGRLWVASSSLVARSAGTVREWLEQGDYDLVLRLTERACTIAHVPKVLCERGPKNFDAPHLETAALRRALRRRMSDGKVTPGCARGIYRIRRKRVTSELVSIIIPTCAAMGLVRTCLTSLRQKTAYRNFEIICIENIPAEKADWRRWVRSNVDVLIETAEPFNWSRFNNLAAARAKGRFLLFLNDDTEIIDPDWLDILLAHAERPEVGAVGPQLLYTDRTVQHAGLMLTDVGRARHAFRHAQPDDPGYFGLALTERNVIGVTGACLLTRREVFDSVGRLTEAHSIVNNDVDYCLKTWRGGYLNIYTPHTRLIHHELGSRGELSEDYDSRLFADQWRDVFLRRDPYLNPNLSRNDDNLTPEREPVRVICASHPLMSLETVRKVLVVKLDHIGDCVTALPAVRRLHQLFPRSHISILTNRATRSLWEGEPSIDNVLEFDFFNPRSALGKARLKANALLELRDRLAGFGFDLAVDLRKSIDTRHVLKYCGARFLAGFDFRGQCPWLDIALEWEGDTRYSPKRQHVADDLLNLVNAIGTRCAPGPQIVNPDPKIRLAIKDVGRLFRKKVVCIHPAAGNETKQWPAQYFASLIDLLAAHVDLHIIVVGGRDEMAIGRAVCGAVRRRTGVYNLVGKVALRELPTLLEKCALFIGNDSGPKHIADGLNIPTIGLHSGVVDATEWGPLGGNAVAMQRKMSCSPCYSEKRSDCPRNLACLHGLDPGSVYVQALRMLAIRGARASGFS
jgi:ADP-heptose:LPS heptosyltransferase/GT2 family glycosyltransferase